MSALTGTEQERHTEEEEAGMTNTAEEEEEEGWGGEGGGGLTGTSRSEDVYTHCQYRREAETFTRRRRPATEEKW